MRMQVPQLFLPDLLYADGRSRRAEGLLVGENGRVLGIGVPESTDRVDLVRLPGKALLPGLANAHSHSFQRLFRGRAEGRASGGETFWTWREQMYRAANFVSPTELFGVARATFLEMICAGITVVGEFHYLHNDRDGTPYADPNTLAREVIRAAESVGIRICLLRTAYLRAGFGLKKHPGQQRFYEECDAYLRNLEDLAGEFKEQGQVSVGVAPHSIRAVPLADLERIAAFAQGRALPMHMHISEQPAENEACIAEYGTTPVELLAAKGLLNKRSTLVHAIHLSEREFEHVAEAGSTICSCPTTERNLGDGIFPADLAAKLGIPVAFGTDSQAQIDILEDARQSEYHLRLAQRERGILDGIHGRPIADRLLHSASGCGYQALGLSGGGLAPGDAADFFTIDLEDIASLGTDEESLAAQVVFGSGRSAIRDVAVAGRFVLKDGRHPLAAEIASRYREVQRRYVSGR